MKELLVFFEKIILMYISSHNLNFLISPNLKYMGFYQNNIFYLYRERTFIGEIEIKGLDNNLFSLSDKGELLALHNNTLYLYSIDTKGKIEQEELNKYFKEIGNLSNFYLLPKEKKVFFSRNTQDRSIFAKLAKKETTIQEICILNLINNKEEIILTKKSDNPDDLYKFKLSSFGNYILLADPEKFVIKKINLINYVEELSFSVDNVEVIDFFVNNEGDCLFFLKEESKKGIYFIGKDNSKNIIKPSLNIEDYTVLNFTSMYFVLRNKAYPEVLIIKKDGQKYISFSSTEVDSLGYPNWVIAFPNYDDIITIYLRQLKLPSDIFFYSYNNFNMEIIRWKAKGKKSQTETKRVSDQILNFEQLIEQQKQENPKEQQTIENKFSKVFEINENEEKIERENIKEDEKQDNLIKKNIIDESTLTKKMLEEVKEQASKSSYDPSSLLKLIEESEQEKTTKQENIQETQKEIPQVPQKFQKQIVDESTLNKKAIEEIKIQSKDISYNPKSLLNLIEETEKKEIPQEIKIKSSEVIKSQQIEEKLVTTSTEKNKIEKPKEEIKNKEEIKTIDVNLDKIMKKLESKIEKQEVEKSQILQEDIKSEEGLIIEIKKELSAEDIEKLENEKKLLTKQLSELKFLKSIKEISEEEYQKKLKEIKDRLEEIKKLLESNQ